jgi:DNA-binding NtrC family response regulator
MKYLPAKLLIVDDDSDTLKFWKVALEELGFTVQLGTNLREMEEAVRRESFDAVLLDMELGDDNGLDGIPFLVSESPFSKIFILTAHGSIETAVQSMKRGATGYVTKDMPPEKIAAQIRAQLDLPDAKQSGKITSEVFAQHGLIGKSKSFQELCVTIDRIKDVDSTVLILGESGTGKEVIAKTLHAMSARGKKRFEAINCAAIPENLLESELFGHKRGAFTDAKMDRKGIFELCSEGTLLLDEIGDMPFALQAKLLRVLQERSIVPVGSSTEIKINTRVVAATHCDIIDEIQSGRFREDLYFRLSVVPIHVPPLRHRKEDIPLLVNYFLDEFNRKFNRDVTPPNAEIMNRVMAYDWPGNIRELRNAIERAVVLSADNSLSIKDIFQHLYQPGKIVEREDPELETLGGDEKVYELPLTEAKQAFEKSYIEKYLKVKKGNITEVAKQAGRYRVDVYRLIEKYGIDQNIYR